VERLRSPDARDKAAARHQALEAALKAGLPVDSTPAQNTAASRLLGRIRQVAQTSWGAARCAADTGEPGAVLLVVPAARMPGEGRRAERMLRGELQRHHVRHDAFEVVERTPPLAA
jgi:hypothetical protein